MGSLEAADVRLVDDGAPRSPPRATSNALVAELGSPSPQKARPKTLVDEASGRSPDRRRRCGATPCRSAVCCVCCCTTDGACAPRDGWFYARWSVRALAWTTLVVAAYEVSRSRAARAPDRRRARPVVYETLRPRHANGTNATAPCASSIVVVATNFKNDDGAAKLWLHDDAAEWNLDKNAWANDRGAALVAAKPIVDRDNVNWTLPVARPGRFHAVLVLHDKNRDGEMKTNGVGKPKEGVGASRGAQGSWRGGPRWGKAKFWVPVCARATVPVELWYS